MKNVVHFTYTKPESLEWRSHQKTKGGPISDYIIKKRVSNTKSAYEKLADLALQPQLIPPDVLFLRFAKLAPTQDAILKFAEQYGLLGREEVLEYREPSRIPLLTGESLERWQKEIHVMRYAVEIWRAIKDRDAPDIDVLTRYISWEANTFALDLRGRPLEGREWVLFHSHPLEEFHVQDPPPTHHMADIAVEDETAHFIGSYFRAIRFERFDYVKAADVYLFQEHYHQLTQTSQTSQTSTTNEKTVNHVHLGLTWDAATQRQQGILYADSLLTFMWLQFHEAITGTSLFKTCQRCGEWFTHGKSRGQPAKWCSESCRVQNSRERNHLKVRSQKTRVATS